MTRRGTWLAKARLANVDDTFAYVNHVPRLRKRVDSNASSFYFRAPAHWQEST
jgi:hypothetical protein